MDSKFLSPLYCDENRELSMSLQYTAKCSVYTKNIHYIIIVRLHTYNPTISVLSLLMPSLRDSGGIHLTGNLAVFCLWSVLYRSSASPKSPIRMVFVSLTLCHHGGNGKKCYLLQISYNRCMYVTKYGENNRGTVEEINFRF